MKTLAEQLDLYADCHTNLLNKITHYIGVPCVIIAVMMFFNWVSLDIASLWKISFTWLALTLLTIYYLILNIRLGILAGCSLLLLAFLATLFSGPTPTKVTFTLFCVLFIGGWACLFIGHLFEKKQPAFFKSLIQLLIGPLFFVVEILNVFKIKKYFIP
jgi:uncharacterized membrane protein YGL010W